MRIQSATLALCLSAALCSAQSTSDDATLLQQVRSKYDTPFERNLKSFDCKVAFDWKKHWTETYRLGDEGTDEEIEKFVQHLPNRVTVTRDDAIMSSGMTEEQQHNMPHGGMAEGLLQHAVRFSLRTWLVASNNALLPATGTPVHFDSSTSGYKLQLKMQTFDVVMLLTHDMRLQSMAAKQAPADHQDLEFNPGPHGFLLGSWTMREDGNFRSGNRLIFSYTYQTVGGFQVPAQMVVNRESHHEIWRFQLTDCSVKTTD